jgi:hypothetical protein
VSIGHQTLVAARRVGVVAWRPRSVLAGAIGLMVAAAVLVHLTPNSASGGIGTAAIVCILISVLLAAVAAFRLRGGSRFRRLCVAVGAAAAWLVILVMVIGLVTLVSGHGPE